MYFGKGFQGDITQHTTTVLRMYVHRRFKIQLLLLTECYTIRFVNNRRDILFRLSEFVNSRDTSSRDLSQSESTKLIPSNFVTKNINIAILDFDK